MFDFPKADPVPRGCGDREPGGAYIESGLSPWGRPLEAFLIDPPLPMPDGLDLVNKPTLWQRTLSGGEVARDADGVPIYDVLIWVGCAYYPYCPDFIEEVRRYGASRKLNPNLDLSLLSQASHMILAHPRVINRLWQTQRPPQRCEKHIEGHDLKLLASEKAQSAWITAEDDSERTTSQDVPSNRSLTAPHARPINLALAPVRHQGPCLYKLWELIPQQAAQTVMDEVDPTLRALHLDTDPLPLCLRSIGSTIYQYHPTGESAEGLIPGLFAALPITGVALIRFADGSVNEKARQKMQAGMQSHGEHALSWYESDR
jgi:hypothetical protein